jgi:signal transduction histidine kinase
MKFLILVNFLFSLNLSAAELLQWEESRSSAGNPVYVFKFDGYPSCVEVGNCYLFVGTVNDGYRLDLNGNLIENRSDTYDTASSISIALPISFFVNGQNRIELEVTDLNGFRAEINPAIVRLGEWKAVSKLVIWHWLKKTGSVLVSIYFLIVVCLLMVAFYLLNRKVEFLSIAAYSLVATVYLISFSEVLRTYFDPVILSGLVHFPLRLFQDLFLVFLFYKFLDLEKSTTKVVKIVAVMYGLVIFLMAAMGVLGVRNYFDYLTVIKIAAPLVAFPMGYGFFLCRRLVNSDERSILVPISFVLFLLQLNDLLVFWNLLDSFYFVKIYIPFIVLLLCFIQVKRFFKLLSDQEQLAQRSLLVSQIMHDIRSPVSALNVVKKRIENLNPDVVQLLEASINRISSIVDSYSQKTRLKKCDIASLVSEIVSERKTDLTTGEIRLVCDHKIKDLFIEGDRVEIGRVLSNLINNAVQSNPNDPRVLVTVLGSAKHVTVLIEDNGAGIPPLVISNLGKPFNTYGKEGGTGLGLYHAKRTMEAVGGSIEITNLNTIGRSGSLIKLIFASATS